MNRALPVLLFLFVASPLLANDYTISSNSTLQNGGNTIGDGDTLTLQEDSSLNVAGDAIFSSDGPRVEVYGDIVSGEDGVQLGASSTFILHSDGSVSAGNATNENGVEITGSNATVDIYGSVDAYYFGIWDGGASNTGSIFTVHNGGSIISSNNDGVHLNGPNTLVVYGVIESNGDDAVDFEGPATLRLYGTLKSDSGEAIEVDDGASIYVNEGARIIGGIAVKDLGDSNLYFDVGSSMSYVFETTNTSGASWTLQDMDGRTVVEGSAMAAGIGNAETADELMFDRSMSLNSSLTRLERQVADGERQALFDTYGFSHSRDEVGTTSAYELDSRGMTIGMPLELLDHEAIAFVNYHDSEVNITRGTHDIDAQSLRFGLFVPDIWSGENFNIGVYAVAGRNSYDGLRDVLVNQNTTTGITSIAASWNSSEIEIGIESSNSYPINSSLTLYSSLGLAAQVERIGSYAEQDYFGWDSRTILQAHSKAEVTLGYQATDSTRIYGAAGAWHRDVRSGETAHYTINNTAVSYNGGVYDHTITSVRFSLEHQLNNGATIITEAFSTASGVTDRSLGASLGITARF
jgi:hypothetical protein